MTTTLSKEVTAWWKSVDVDNPFITKLWFSMYGTAEQRIQQLYIIRNNLGI